MKRPKPIRQASDTIDVLSRSTKKRGTASVKQIVPSTPPNMTNSSNISEHDLSLTFSSTGRTPEVLVTSKTRKPASSPNNTERTVYSALRRLAPEPFASMSGSCHNPIIVNETSSPPRRTARAPKRRYKHKRLTESHHFLGNGYRDLYSYRPSSSALAAMPASGSTFTGHQSHDIYRMMNAKIIAAPDFSPNAAWGRHTLNVPFEVQYPLSAQVLAQKHHAPQHQSPYAQHYDAQVPLNAYGHPTVPSQNENLLRNRAVYCIREYSLPSPSKRSLSDADPNETSGEEAQEHQKHAGPQPSSSKTQSGVMSASTARNVDLHTKYRATAHSDSDPNFVIGHLIEHTSLITSLLELYPHSTDRKGLRNDISMMVQVQNRLLSDWMKAESQPYRKRRKYNTISIVSPPQSIVTRAMRTQNEKDHTLRQAFSASADMWQDGTGYGVADVFAVVPASSPVESKFDRELAGHKHTPSSSARPDHRGDGKTGSANSVTTTPIQQTPGRRATAVRCREVPTTLIQNGTPKTLEHIPIPPEANSKAPSSILRQPNPSKDPIPSIKLPSHAIKNLFTPNTETTPSFHHNNSTSSPTRSNHIIPVRPAPSSDDNKLHAPINGNASSSFYSESSDDFRVGKPVFQFERHTAVDGEEIEPGTVPSPTVKE